MCLCMKGEMSARQQCVAAGYSLLVASLADMFPSTCWDRPRWQRYWEIISVSPTDIAVWRSLLASLSLPPHLSHCSPASSFVLSVCPPFPHLIMFSLLLGPWHLSGHILPLPAHLATGIDAKLTCCWIPPLIAGLLERASVLLYIKSSEAQCETTVNGTMKKLKPHSWFWRIWKCKRNNSYYGGQIFWQKESEIKVRSQLWHFPLSSATM